MKADAAVRLNIAFRKSQEFSRDNKNTCKTEIFGAREHKPPAFCGPFPAAAARTMVVMLSGPCGS